MTTPTLDLPNFPGHAYGVSVSHIGEERDMVAHGHIEPRRFIAACNWWHREATGIPSLGDDGFGDIDMTYVELLSWVRHRWAIRQPKCDCPEDQVLERGCDDHDPDPDPDAWWISLKGVTEDTPGAFPITLGVWS